MIKTQMEQKMNNKNRILLADDEKTFLDSTGELIRREGYDCVCVSDAFEAIEQLKQQSYDLLISDIKMPGNPELELIKEVQKIARGTQVILITGFPSAKSAIESIQLPVSAYMVKPISFQELKQNIEIAIKQKELYEKVAQTKDRLKQWRLHIDTIEQALQKRDERTFSTSVKSFLDLTCSNICASLVDFKNITQILTNENSQAEICNLVNCPRLKKLSEGVNETIKILELTKSSFKSKELGDLRISLEKLIKKNKIV
jgi:YesN/AraC family two-component response regulator